MRGIRAKLCDELGDLLMQIVLHARLPLKPGNLSWGM